MLFFSTVCLFLFFFFPPPISQHVYTVNHYFQKRQLLGGFSWIFFPLFARWKTPTYGRPPGKPLSPPFPLKPKLLFKPFPTIPFGGKKSLVYRFDPTTQYFFFVWVGTPFSVERSGKSHSPSPPCGRRLFPNCVTLLQVAASLVQGDVSPPPFVLLRKCWPNP